MSVFFFANKVSYVLHQTSDKDSAIQMHRVDWEWQNCNDITPHFKGATSKLPHNYYFDSIKIVGIESGQKIIYENIYDGVSLVFYLKDQSLKYDYVVKSASALDQIKSTYAGAEFNLLAEGQLEIQTSLGTISDSKPVSFDKNGQLIWSEFILEGDELKYNIQADIEYPIIIDPEVQWSTYFGGFQSESPTGVAHDDSNNVYLGGVTYSTDFPTTIGAYSSSSIGGGDCFLTKLNSKGKLIWSTYFGGSNNDLLVDFTLGVNALIHCTVVTSSSTPYPITSNAQRKTNSNGGAYTRFDRNGKLIYSTYLQLSQSVVAADTSGRVYIFGQASTAFLTQGNSFQKSFNGTYDFGILAFNDKDKVVWSTLFGGSSGEGSLLNIAVNPKGDKIVLTGATSSRDFPTKRAYADSTNSGFRSFFITACFDSKGNLMWSTYLCSPDGISGIGNKYGLQFINDSKVALGQGNFQSNFPNKKNTWIAKANLQGSFVAILDTSSQVHRLSFDSPQSQSLGRFVTGLAVDNNANLHVVCNVYNDSLRPTADAIKKVGSDFFIGSNAGEIGYFVMDTSFNIKYATYIGGNKSYDQFARISVNSNNEATIVLESANNSDFPTKNAIQNRLAGSSDLAIIQFGCNYEPKTNLAKGTTICKGDSVILKVDSGFAKYEWSPVTSSNNTLVAKKPGKYYVMLTDSNGCAGGLKDSFELDQFTPLNPTIQSLDATQFCSGDSARLRGRVSNFKSIRWNNGDTTLRTAAFKSGKYFLTATDSNGCVDTSNNINIQAIPKPNPVITSSTGSTNFCRKYNEITLDVGTGYNAYKWSTGATTNAIKVSKTGWYKVVVFNGFNCSDSDSVFVSNSLAKPPVIGTVNPLKFCQGDSVSFTAPSGYSNFLWSTGSRNQSIKVGRNRDVFLIASDTNGCRDTSNIIRTERIVDSLKIKSSGMGPFCFDETLTLQVDTGFTSYKWSNGDSTRSISTQISGNYFVSAISASGCRVQSDTFKASFFNKTTANILYDDSLKFCAGDSVRLYFSGPFNSFTWSNTTATTQSFYASKSGVYALNIIDTNNCRAVSDSVRVTVDPLPIVQVTSNIGLSFCDKDSALIRTNKSFSSYKWSNGKKSASFYIKKSASLWVEVTDNNGCSNFSDTISISKNNLPDTTAKTIGATTFCQGDSFIIDLIDSTSNVLWRDNNRSYDRVIKSSGSFKAILTNRFGCTDSTRTFTITANTNPQPKLTANGALQYCEDLGPRQISTTNNYASYKWNSGPSTKQISTNTSGNYYVNVVDANGCEGVSDTINLTVYDLPEPEITGLNGISFCNGDSTFITTKKSYAKYLWSNSSTSSGFTVKQNTTVFVEVTDSNGCVNRSNPTRISILPLPPKFSISAAGSPSVCFPNTVSLNGPSNQSKYIWSNGATNSSITLDSTQKVSLTVENIFGCQRKSSDSFQVYVGVPAPLTFEGFTSFCLGDSFYIEAALDYSSYLWSNGDTTNAISITTSDTFYLRTIDSIGCTFNTDTFITEVIPLKVPSPWSLARGSTEFCDGDSLELLSPAGYVSYQWNTGGTKSSTFAKQSGSYEVVVIDSLGCRGRSPAIDVTVFNLPKPVITPIQSVFCKGDTVQLGVAESYVSYLWSTTSFDSIIEITQNGVFSVTVQDTNQCFGKSQDFAVAFNEKPSFTIDTLSLSGICDGDSLTLTVNTLDATSAILWTDQTQERTKVIQSNERYGFTITNLAGCTKSLVDAVFSTFQNPLPNIIINGNDSICEGESVALSLANSYNQVLWNNSINQETIGVGTTGYNKVLVTDNNGCQGKDSVFITTVALPVAKLNIDESVAICPTDSVLLEPTTAFTDYKWNNGATEPSIWVKENGAFWLDVANDFGCTNRSDTVSVEIKQIPASIRLVHNDGILSANSDSLDVFNWYKLNESDNFELLEQDKKKLRIRETNFYYLAAQSNGCNLISDTLFVEYYDSSKTLDFSIYPNPTFDNIFIDIDAVNPDEITCFIINSQGQIMKTYNLGVGDRVGEEIDLLQLSKGIYLVQLVNGDQVYTKPFVKID